MAIEKLSEFAKDGSKETTDLNLDMGFVANRKPARQWFNWLFNTLTLKINEVIDGKLDVSKRGAANGVASLDENKKVPVAELPIATSSVAGVMKLIDDLIIGGADAALTAEAGKLFFNMFAGGEKYFKIPNPNEPLKPWIIQIGKVQAPQYTSPLTFLRTNFNFPVSFPNSVNTVVGTLNVGVYNESWVNYSIENETKTGAIFVYASEGGDVAPGLNYIAIGN